MVVVVVVVVVVVGGGGVGFGGGFGGGDGGGDGGGGGGGCRRSLVVIILKYKYIHMYNKNGSSNNSGSMVECIVITGMLTRLQHNKHKK